MSVSKPYQATAAMAGEYAHSTFHEMATGANVRLAMSALFLEGFTLGAQLALVDPDVARSIVDELIDAPDAIHAVAANIQRIREAAQ